MTMEPQTVNEYSLHEYKDIETLAILGQQRLKVLIKDVEQLVEYFQAIQGKEEARKCKDEAASKALLTAVFGRIV